MRVPLPLAEQIAAVACRTTSYTLADGEQVTEYLDEFLLSADPLLLRDVADHLADLLPTGTQLLAGMALGGVPLAVAVSAVTGLPTVFVRPEPKAYGSGRQVEGVDVTGRRVVLVDDVVRTGRQLICAAEALRRLGASVQTGVCLLDRDLGGSSTLLDSGVDVQALITARSLAGLLATSIT